MNKLAAVRCLRLRQAIAGACAWACGVIAPGALAQPAAPEPAPPAETPPAEDEPNEAAPTGEKPTEGQPPEKSAPVEAEVPPAVAPEPESEPEPDTASVEQRLAELEQRAQALEEENELLREDLEYLQEDQAFNEQRTNQALKVTGKVSGYVDVGFYYVEGDGRGIREDLGYQFFPEYDYIDDSWVFYGDPLATTVNSRGDPADVTNSRAIKFNPIDSNGNASFILNNINLQLFAGIGDHVTVNGMIDFIPRNRDVSVDNDRAMGDFVDVKLGYIEWRVPLEKVGWELSAGKFDSVLGFEYRSQEAPSRLTVTPSLICRYTCGRPIGIKSRLKLFSDALVLNASLTNGSHFVESFAFSNEIDTNQSKTGAGRLSYRFDVGAGLEFGVSGAIGAQDFQGDETVLQRHGGVDVHLEAGGFQLTGEYVRGDVEGATDPATPGDLCGLAPCLDYQGAYGLVGYRVTNWLVPYARVDWRDALHQNGGTNSFVYISDLMRVTGGVRLEPDPAIIVKAEYTHVRELGRVPPINDDVFTSSLVAKF